MFGEPLKTSSFLNEMRCWTKLFLPLLLCIVIFYCHLWMKLPNRGNKLVRSGIYSMKSFNGYKFEMIQSMIKDVFVRNIRIYITEDPHSAKEIIDIVNITTNFPTIIDVAKAKQLAPEVSKKYVYVHYMFNDQLSMNTRSFLSLCAQAGRTKRYVVKPFVKDTKLGSDESWLDFEYYYNVDYLKDLLIASNYAGLVNKDEYIRECPVEDPDHVSIHFIDNSESSKNVLHSKFHVKDDNIRKITANAYQHGWTECNFLDKAMSRAPGRQYCVHSVVITDWKILEQEIVKEHKCLNVFHWRGIYDDSYRLEFSEDDLKFTSKDLTFALRTGIAVENQVKYVANKFLDSSYIAVYVRGEHILRTRNMDYLRKCIDMVLNVSFISCFFNF